MNRKNEVQGQLSRVIKGLNLTDDIFFGKVAEDKDACEEMLRAIMGEVDLQLELVEPQKFIRNCGSRSVCVDVLCTAVDGRIFGVEMQKSNKDNHFKRVRYEASNIDTLMTERGIDFAQVPDVTMIYITNFDMFRRGCALYHMEHMIRESAVIVDNGSHEIYFNIHAKDGTLAAKLGQYMAKTEGVCPEFPAISARVNYLKMQNKGERPMENPEFRRLMREYAQILAEEIVEEKLERMAISVTQKVTDEVTQKVTEEVSQQMAENAARNFLRKGVSVDIVAECIKEISIQRIQELYSMVNGQQCNA